MKILIVNEHAVVRAGTRLLLQEAGDANLCDEAGCGYEALCKVRGNDYDVVLMDLDLSDMDGFEVLSGMKQDRPRLPVVVVSMHTEEQHAIKAYTFGADGYVGMESTPSDLIHAVDKVAGGGKFVSEHLIEALMTELRNAKSSQQASTLPKPLSRREKQIAEMLVSGSTNKEIAWQLSLSVKTVSTYKARILDKLNLNSLTELIKYAMMPNTGSNQWITAKTGRPGNFRANHPLYT